MAPVRRGDLPLLFPDDAEELERNLHGFSFSSKIYSIISLLGFVVSQSKSKEAQFLGNALMISGLSLLILKKAFFLNAPNLFAKLDLKVSDREFFDRFCQAAENVQISIVLHMPAIIENIFRNGADLNVQLQLTNHIFKNQKLLFFLEPKAFEGFFAFTERYSTRFDRSSLAHTKLKYIQNPKVRVVYYKIFAKSLNLDLSQLNSHDQAMIKIICCEQDFDTQGLSKLLKLIYDDKDIRYEVSQLHLLKRPRLLKEAFKWLPLDEDFLSSRFLIKKWLKQTQPLAFFTRALNFPKKQSMNLLHDYAVYRNMEPWQTVQNAFRALAKCSDVNRALQNFPEHYQSRLRWCFSNWHYFSSLDAFLDAVGKRFNDSNNPSASLA